LVKFRNIGIMAHMKNSLTKQPGRGKALVGLQTHVPPRVLSPSSEQPPFRAQTHESGTEAASAEGRIADDAPAAPLSAYLAQPAVTAKLRQELDRLDVAAFAHWATVRDTAARTDVRGIRPLLETFVPLNDADADRFVGRVQIRTVQTFDDTSTTWLKSSGRAIPGRVYGHIDADGDPVIDSAEIVFAQPA
jgi:hypothetical protein